VTKSEDKKNAADTDAIERPNAATPSVDRPWDAAAALERRLKTRSGNSPVFFEVLARGRTVARASWFYPSPMTAFQTLAGHMSFYVGAMDAFFADDERVIPQPGNFYGGWVIANLQGRIKGAPGSERW